MLFWLLSCFHLFLCCPFVPLPIPPTHLLTSKVPPTAARPADHSLLYLSLPPSPHVSLVHRLPSLSSSRSSSLATTLLKRSASLFQLPFLSARSHTFPSIYPSILLAFVPTRKTAQPSSVSFTSFYSTIVHSITSLQPHP